MDFVVIGRLKKPVEECLFYTTRFDIFINPSFKWYKVLLNSYVEGRLLKWVDFEDAAAFAIYKRLVVKCFCRITMTAGVRTFWCNRTPPSKLLQVLEITLLL